MIVHAPLSGDIVPLSDVDDPVFAQGMLGAGCAIRPFLGGLTVLAPVAGVMKKSMPHATIVTGEEVDVLVHLGLDTVTLKGEGFTELSATGREVEAGQPTTIWNTSVAQNAGISTITPVVAMQVDSSRITMLAEGKVEAGKPLFRIDTVE